MSAPLAPLPVAKLQLLIPRLGSDHDGEVVATAAAIGRTLKRAGADWHDLAAAVSGDSPAPQQSNTAAHKVPASDIRDTVRSIRRSRCYLSRAAGEFLDGPEARADAYATVFLSPKQRDWLADLERLAAT